MPRARLWPAIATSAGAVLVWTAAGELGTVARVWTTFLVGVLPILLIAQTRAIPEAQRLPRTALYGSSAISLWGLAGATVLVAVFGGISPATLGLAPLPWTPALLWTAGVTAAAVLLLFAARAAGIRESDFVAYLLPRTRDEKVLFAGLSLTAGICEEFVFRGFLIPALTEATGSLVAAAAVSSAVFGVLHAYQRPAGAARAAVLGALLAAPLLATGSLVPAIVAHTLIDLLSGLLLRERLLR
jgi:membrane protease YdiL (CAAX protease family)